MTTFSLSLMKGNFFTLDDCMTQINYGSRRNPVEISHLEDLNLKETGAFLRSKGTSILINAVTGYYITFTMMTKEYGQSLTEATFEEIKMELSHFVSEYQYRIQRRKYFY